MIEDAPLDVEAAVRHQFRERADSFCLTMEERWYSEVARKGTRPPAEALFLAHLMIVSSGYHFIDLGGKWDQRPRSGWLTTLYYLPELEAAAPATFALECRHDGHARQLAILIDGIRPGERLPAKIELERRLVSLDFRVMTFSEREILANPTDCRERVEEVLSKMSDEVLEDAGVI